MAPQDKKTPPNARNITVPERDAAINIVRSQIDALYNRTPDAAPAEKPQPTPAVSAPQQQTPTPAKRQGNNQAQNWQQYHNEWQKYYQEYYTRYYSGHVQKVIREQQASNPTPQTETPEDVSTARKKLLSNVKKGAKKARKSRHFIPISAAFVVVLLFAFLQYNSLLIGTVQAYVSPGAIDPQNIIVDPTSTTAVSQDSKLIIPKINVDVPVIYDVALDHDAQMAAMEKGVAHFAVQGADSVPGQVGNAVFSGHSSNDLFEAGDYKFVFAQLDKLESGDTIYMNYQGVRYTYAVTKKEVVAPSNVQALIYTTDKPMLTLITCTPLGTSTNRLLVTAEQVSPDPAKATPSNSSSSSSSDAAMPGNSATALEKLFGSKG